MAARHFLQMARRGAEEAPPVGNSVGHAGDSRGEKWEEPWLFDGGLMEFHDLIIV